MDGDALKKQNMRHGVDKRNVAKTQSQVVSDLFDRQMDVPEPEKPAEPIAYTPTLHKDDPEKFAKLLESNPNRKRIIDEYSELLGRKGESELYDYLFEEGNEDSDFEEPDYDRLRDIFVDSDYDDKDVYANYGEYKHMFGLPSAKEFFGDEKYRELAHPEPDYEGYLSDYYYDTRKD